MSLLASGFAFVRPILHALDPEQAHRATIAALKCLPATKPAISRDPALAVSVFGLDFPNPLGLAPGFDKNAEVPDAMLALGFGFVEVGTVTPRPQAGNPRPRLFRLGEDEAIINRMGFNNEGSDAVARRIAARQHQPGILGINIGANKDASDRVADYVDGVTRFGALASYLTVNISSPNTPGLRALQSREELRQLLDRVNDARARLQRHVPMLLKIAPDLSDEELSDIAATCSATAVDGVIIANTTLARAGLRSARAQEPGGLSGKPLFALSTRQLAKFHRLTGGKLPLIGVGGVFDAEMAWTKICAGASLIQLYSALVFRGPAVIDGILSGLSQKLRIEGFSSLRNAVGCRAAELASNPPQS